MAEDQRDEIARLEALFAANPEGRIFTHLAEAYRKSGDTLRARQVLEHGLARHGDHASAHVVLGRVLWDEGDLTGATQAFRRVVELDPQNSVAVRALADLAASLGHVEDALSHYRNLLSLDPGNDEVQRRIVELEGAAPSGPDATFERELSWDLPVTSNAEHTSGGEEVGATSADVVSDGFDWVPPEPAPPEVAAAAVESGGEPEVYGANGVVFGEEWSGAIVSDAPSAADEDVEIAGTAPVGDVEAADLHNDEPPYEAPADLDSDPTLVTETIGDIYAAQGLSDRAAAVYRRLLEGRPGDERILGKLAALERASDMAAEGAGAETTPAGVAGPSDATSGERDLQEVEAVWTGADGATGTEDASPYAWPGVEGEAPSSDESTIGEYLRALAAWRPTVSVAVASAPQDVLAGADEDSSLDAEFERLFAMNIEGGAASRPADAGAEASRSSADDDDDDLETFRDWLESLKR